jgi:uncharacterized delta-60 repeat protein
MAVARYKIGGGLDQTFSSNGKQTIAFTGVLVTADAVAIQGDGKIVLAGTLFNQAGESFAVVRLNTNGTLDQGFGTGGRVTTTFAAGPAEASSMVIRGDGRIIVAGTVSTAGGQRVGIARYLGNGKLDSSLDGDGRLVTGIGLGIDIGAAGVAADGNKIVVMGTISADGSAWFVARFKSNGGADTTFDGNGEASVGVDGDVEAHGLTITPAGNYLVVGDDENAIGATEMAAVQFLR